MNQNTNNPPASTRLNRATIRHLIKNSPVHKVQSDCTKLDYRRIERIIQSSPYSKQSLPPSDQRPMRNIEILRKFCQSNTESNSADESPAYTEPVTATKTLESEPVESVAETNEPVAAGEGASANPTTPLVSFEDPANAEPLVHSQGSTVWVDTSVQRSRGTPEKSGRSWMRVKID